MTKIKKHKKILYLPLGFLMLTMNTRQCFAYTISINTNPTFDNDSPYTEWAEYTTGTGNKKYRYRYKRVISTSKEISTNAYNLNGDSVMPYDIYIDPKKYTFKAGTWIGVNITETQTAAWAVGMNDFEIEELLKEYTCTYEKTSTKYCNRTTVTSQGACNGSSGKYTPINSSIVGYCTIKYKCGTNTDTFTIPNIKKDYYENYSCPPYYNGYRLKEEQNEEITQDGGGQFESNIKQKAIRETHSAALNMIGAPLAKIKYSTNNDYPEDLTKAKYLTITSASVGEKKDVWTSASSGYVQKDYEYNQKQVCINAKTADVTYGRECTSEELKVNNEQVYDKYLNRTITYWHYFIPLNTKSNSNYSLEIIENENSFLSVEECLNAMETKKNYQDYIVPANDNYTFIGDYKKYANKDLSADYKTLKTSNGCNLSMKINFPISQEFYNETAEYKFKGFNFYYKPIDIHNPFPNGIDNTSVWYNWSKNGKKKPDLTKSYDEITYIAQISNVKSIRDYTKNNPYTSWDNMYINGTSSFVEKQGVIKRLVDRNSFYNLGCGPSNSDWSECKK